MTDEQTNTNAESLVATVQDTSQKKDQNGLAKNPQRMLNFWTDFMAKQKQTSRLSGKTTFARVTSARLIKDQNGQQVVKVGFENGGGLIDAGDKVHLYCKLNNNTQRPSLSTLLQAIKSRGWDAVAMEVDGTTREALLRECERIGIKVSEVKPKPVYKPQTHTPVASVPTPLRTILAQKATQEAEKQAAWVSRLSGIAKENRIDAEQAALGTVAWRIGTKPTQRKSNLHSKRKTNKTQMLECCKIESKLLAQTQEQYNQIIHAVQDGFQERQLNVWREKYYGSEGLGQKIEDKKQKGLGLTSAESKLVRVVELYGIKEDQASEKVLPVQQTARKNMPIADYDKTIADEYRAIKVRKKTILDLKKRGVQCACAEYRLKALQSDRSISPPYQEKIVAKVVSLLPKDKKDTKYLTLSKERLQQRLKTVKQSCLVAKTEVLTKDQVEQKVQQVAQKVKDQTQKNAFSTKETQTNDLAEQKRQEIKKIKARKNAEKRGVSMQKFVSDHREPSR